MVLSSCVAWCEYEDFEDFDGMLAPLAVHPVGGGPGGAPGGVPHGLFG